MEIDFLISRPQIGRKHNITPIEVKSGKRYSTVSLLKFCEKYKDYIGKPYVLHTGDVDIRSNMTFLPIYMAPFL